MKIKIIFFIILVCGPCPLIAITDKSPSQPVEKEKTKQEDNTISAEISDITDKVKQEYSDVVSKIDTNKLSEKLKNILGKEDKGSSPSDHPKEYNLPDGYDIKKHPFDNLFALKKKNNLKIEEVCENYNAVASMLKLSIPKIRFPLDILNANGGFSEKYLKVLSNPPIRIEKRGNYLVAGYIETPIVPWEPKWENVKQDCNWGHYKKQLFLNQRDILIYKNTTKLNNIILETKLDDTPPVSRYIRMLYYEEFNNIAWLHESHWQYIEGDSFVKKPGSKETFVLAIDKNNVVYIVELYRDENDNLCMNKENTYSIGFFSSLRPKKANSRMLLRESILPIDQQYSNVESIYNASGEILKTRDLIKKKSIPGLKVSPSKEDNPFNIFDVALRKMKTDKIKNESSEKNNID